MSGGIPLPPERFAPSIANEMVHCSSGAIAGREQKEYKGRRHSKRRTAAMQHFLLSSAAVSLSIDDVASMSDAAVRRLVRQMRWPDTNGKPICPRCDHDRIYEMASGRLKCAACRRLFSETSGTILHNRKLPLRTILMAIFLWTNGAKGVAALHMRRDLSISYKSAFVLLHKLREAIGDARDDLKVGGVVEIDAAYVGGHIRPPNIGREGRRPAVRSRKQCVLTMVERGGSTINLIVDGETTEAVMAAVGRHVQPGSTIVADEHAAYNALHARYTVHRINHRWEYARGDVNTNAAESTHSRLRRSENGIHHRICGPYLGNYAHEMAYRGDRRRCPNGDVFRELGEMALMHPVSRVWTGRWQARPDGKQGDRKVDIRPLIWTPLEPFEPWRWAA
ncbi:IS1595 family transposase [Inquilinus sp. CAU 1745]|uniref:IS1595 family transposase n=1 Tax=Inquilinus sp. CAU 1745 TaxID=3140369 RepID=UPI00325A5831